MSVKLALIGRNIAHSKSPSLQRDIWGDELLSYDLIDVADPQSLPKLSKLATQYLGVNITTPYKESYFNEVSVESNIAEAIGAINTISLVDMSGTNTDALAVERILANYQQQIPRLVIHLLGGGVMARMTVLIAQQRALPLHSYTRQTHGDLSVLDLSKLDSNDLVINSCSRQFIFSGKINSRCHFWDYNYAFPAHHYLQQRVSTYQDGQELLQQQAICAAQFWRQKAKLNY